MLKLFYILKCTYRNIDNISLAVSTSQWNVFSTFSISNPNLPGSCVKLNNGTANPMILGTLLHDKIVCKINFSWLLFIDLWHSSTMTRFIWWGKIFLSANNCAHVFEVVSNT